VVLVWNAEFDSIEQAFAFEKRIAGWRREKKEALMRGEYDALHELSRRKKVREQRQADGG
jgi:predicted GIY-YIG superfamily endonuclease